jgi:hypothetical protein
MERLILERGGGGGLTARSQSGHSATEDEATRAPKMI